MKALHYLLVILILNPWIFTTAQAQDWELGPVPEVDIECLASSETAGTVLPNPFLDGDWLQFRRDRKLTGRSPLIGNITCPKLLWTIDLGARTTWFSIHPSNESSDLDLPVSGETGDRWNTGVVRFEMRGMMIDLNGDGSVMVDPLDHGNHLVGDLLPGISGFERIICAPDWGSVENRCYLHNWINGEWKEVWHSDLEHFEGNHGARPLIGDFDNDGSVEVVVQSWFQIHILDLETGQLEQSGTFLDPLTPGTKDNPTGRAYGWFGLANVDGERNDEFVIVGDIENFIAVMGWENDSLKLLWEYRIEPNIFETFTRHHVLVNPVADIDGDGLPEITTSIFNENRDEKWHVIVLDGATGDVELDLPNAYLSGLGDLDGDGVAELLVSESKGHGIPEFTDTYVLSFIGKSESKIWTGAGESFELYQSPGFADNVNSSTIFYRRSVFLRDGWETHPVFATRSPGSDEHDIKLRFYQWSEGGLAESASVNGPRLQIISLPHSAPERGILVQAIADSAEEGPVELTNLSATLEVTGRIDQTEAQMVTKVAFTFQTFSAVSRLKPGGPVTVVTQDYAERIRAYDVTSGETPVELWRTDGRGFTSGTFQRPIASTNEFRSVVLADVNGGGDTEVIMADRTQDGKGLMKAVDADGDVVWETQLPTPGPPPVWGDAGITHWVAGHFRSPTHEDVLVSSKRRNQHNNELRLIDGLSGEVVWSSIDGGVKDCFAAQTVGPGAALMPVLDWDNDGLDEVLNIASNVFAVYDGVDGSLLTVRPILTEGECPELNPISGLDADGPPITPIADFLNNGSEQLLFGKHYSTMGVLELNGDPVWLTEPHSGMPDNTLQGIADLDGDGDLEIVVVGQCSTAGAEVRAYNGSGTLRWTMAMQGACEGPGTKALSSGDLDGDGKEEVYFTQTNDLFALAEINGNGTILWRATFSEVGHEYSTAVIADVDGTGRPQILINSPDGYVFGLGSSSDVFQVNAGHSGAWFNPVTSGQGQFIDIEPAEKFMFLSWFTYTDAAADNPNEQKWYTAQGNYSGNTAQLNLFETLGGKFDETQKVTTNQVGEVTLSFSDCGQGQMSYGFDDGRQGQFPMKRVIPGSDNTCEERIGNNPEAVDINAGMDGSWFDPNTSGQGFFIDSYPDPEGGDFIFVSWFTYGDDTVSGQRWLTAQGSFEGPTAIIDVFETTGGSFDDPRPTETVKVGTMNIHFTDCCNAQLSYSLTDDNLEGNIAITRVVPGGQALCEELAGAD